MTARDRRFRWDLISVIIFLGLGAIWVMVELGAAGALHLGGKPYRIEVAVSTAASLTPGARVTVAGIRVGSVTSIKRDGAAARIGLRIDDKRVTPLPADSRVRVRARSAVGENYVSILAGRAKTSLAAGSVVPADQTGEYVDVDQILSVLRGPTRAHARLLFQSVGKGLSNRGTKLNEVLGDGSDMVTGIARIVDTVHPRRDNLSRLVDGVGVVSAAVGQRGDAIRALARDGSAALTAVGTRDHALAEVLRELPATLDRVRSTSSIVRSTTERAAPVVSNLAVALREIRPSIRSLQPATVTAQTMLRTLDGATPSLRRLLGDVSSASRPLAAALPDIHTVFCQANPALDYLKPYTADLLDTLTGLGSLANSYDATGHTARLGLVFSDNTVSGLPDSVTNATQTLFHTGLLSKLGARSYNAYPKPGEVGTGVGTPGGPQGPTEVPATGYVYPRIKASC